MLNNTKTQSRPTLLFLVPAISQTHKSLENFQDFFVKTKTKTKTLFFVLEALRDQDFGLEDYITAVATNTSISGFVKLQLFLFGFILIRTKKLLTVKTVGLLQQASEAKARKRQKEEAKMSTKAKRLFLKPKPDDVTGTTKKRRRKQPMTADASAQLVEHVDQTPCMFCDIRYCESNVGVV